MGAFVWFAHIIEWEFPKFSVDRCLEQLLEMQKKIDDKGCVEGTIHRYLIIAKSKILMCGKVYLPHTNSHLSSR